MSIYYLPKNRTWGACAPHCLRKWTPQPLLTLFRLLPSLHCDRTSSLNSSGVWYYPSDHHWASGDVAVWSPFPLPLPLPPGQISVCSLRVKTRKRTLTLDYYFSIFPKHSSSQASYWSCKPVMTIWSHETRCLVMGSPVVLTLSSLVFPRLFCFQQQSRLKCI